MRQATRWSILLSVALATVIALLTLMPPTQVDVPAGGDKFYHFTAFVALAFPLAVVRPRWSVVLFVVYSAYGAAIEIIQPYVGRSREVADLLADMVGIAVGMLLGLLVRRLVEHVHPRVQPSGDASPSKAWSGPGRH
ncbi:VanZ family protein [Tessaracoccus antarcticus]|uniref:VanZ family protein n=1 Tax=Tessaracoccus antarcticus TaxID=2479848 RepID=A0A3M0G5N9_9ACTN|nr:VanZ family protein [Tessaracoccus antarcticus]RMB59878.1 VanZ family protein [Tessaracoccus antarcticus]